jgi:hypothetical protein
LNTCLIALSVITIDRVPKAHLELGKRRIWSAFILVNTQIQGLSKSALRHFPALEHAIWRYADRTLDQAWAKNTCVCTDTPDPEAQPPEAQPSFSIGA